jgi:hypothetical protein
VKFGIGGREYEFDGDLTVEDAIFLQEKTGLGVNQFFEALDQIKGLPVAAWMFLLKRRAGEAVRWDDMMKLNIRTYRIIPDEPAADSKPASSRTDGEAAGPTSRSGTTRKAATSRTK